MMESVLAYIDPNTGGALVALLLAVSGTLVFVVREVVSRLSVGSLSFRRKPTVEADVIVYADDARYASTFIPVLERLDADGVDVAYLTQSEDDPVLSRGFEHVRCECVGRGRRAFSRLNRVKARVVLSTTPGLDVYGWRRSPHVDEYVHVFHAMGTALGYRMYGLDFYDTLLMSSDVLDDEVRSVERARGIPEKRLVTCGLPYFDALWQRAAAHTGRGDYVLFAPSWGKSSLLSTRGSEVIRALLDAGERVRVRPHPQSRTSDAKVLARLRQEFEGEDVEWDETDDNFDSLAGAKAMVTDFSGVMFDYAFGFGGRVAYSLATYDPSAYDAFDYEGEQLRFKLCDMFAKRMSGDEDMGDVVRWLTSLDGEGERLAMMAEARETLWQRRYESAGRVAAYVEGRVAELGNLVRERERESRCGR